MTEKRKGTFLLLFGISGFLFWVSGFYFWMSRRDPIPTASPTPMIVQAPSTVLKPGITGSPPAASLSARSEVTPEQEAEEDPDDSLTEEERHKQIDRKNLSTIYGGLQAFFAKNGHYPDHLSEMVPDFIPEEALFSPRTEEHGLNRKFKDYMKDPGLEGVGYCYEYRNLKVRRRMLRDLKDVQRAEWGDVVPVLRAVGYDKVQSLAWSGEIYETPALQWEHAEETLDIIDRIGWGPGMQNSDKNIDIIVTDEAGKPVSGAEVWADGRHFHFSLPERPFVTGANGRVRIPLGDADTSPLMLRLEADGHAAEAIEFGRGAAPEQYEMKAVKSQKAQGRLLDEEGYPLANTRVVVTTKPDESGAAALVDYTRTDGNGNWTADVLPDDAEDVTARPRFNQ